MECLDQELLGLFEMGRLSLDDLKKISRAKAPRTNQPGIYVHVIYDTTNLDSIGVYVGSTYWLLHRMKEHKNDLLVARSGSQRRRTKKSRSIKHLSKHVEFWSGPGMQDFWLCFEELKVHVPRAQAEERGFGPLLNILEKYTALLFCTLPRKWLEAGLPRGSKKKLYAWIGLNNDDPLLQYRMGTFPSGQSSAILEKGKSRMFPHRSHRGEGGFSHYADTSKGDKAQVVLICGKCLNPEIKCMDQNPRYHISSGGYLSRIYQQCICCPWPKVNCFVSADISLPYRYFRAAEQSWRLQRIEQEARRTTSLIELQNAPMGVVHAWIGLQDYAKRETIDKRDLALQIWDHNQRAVSKLNSPVTNRQDREQIEQMTTEELCIWIRSKGYPVSYAKPARDIEPPPVCKKTLLNRALEVQDALERKSGMITDLHNTLITRTDLGKMCAKELVDWIGSKGFSSRSYVIQKKAKRFMF